MVLLVITFTGSLGIEGPKEIVGVLFCILEMQ
jgi:hypothetical protein